MNCENYLDGNSNLVIKLKWFAFPAFSRIICLILKVMYFICKAT
jgi:hypothetical protein